MTTPFVFLYGNALLLYAYPIYQITMRSDRLADPLVKKTLVYNPWFKGRQQGFFDDNTCVDVYRFKYECDGGGYGCWFFITEGSKIRDCLTRPRQNAMIYKAVL